jgi:hypothetical protein
MTAIRSRTFVVAALLAALSIPSAALSAQRNNDWMLRQQAQQRAAEAQRLRDQERQRMRDQERQRLRDQERQRMRAQEQQRLRDSERQRAQQQARANQAARSNAAAAQRAAANRNAAAGAIKRTADRTIYANGVAKLNKPPTTAEMKRGFTGRVTPDGRAIVRVRGRVFAVPASRIGVRPPANNNRGTSRLSADRRAAVASSIQRLAGSKVAASSAARRSGSIAPAAGGSGPDCPPKCNNGTRSDGDGGTGSGAAGSRRSGSTSSLTETFNKASGAAFRQTVPVAEREKTVLQWYMRHSDIRTEKQAREYLAGTDLTKAVFVRRLQKGERLQVWVPRGKAPGKHFTPPGTSTSRLGINGDRVLQTWVVEEEFDVLESTAADFPEGKYEGIGGAGGGEQVVMPPDWNKKMRIQ